MIALLIAKNEFIRSLKSKKKVYLMFLLPLMSIFLAVALNALMKPSINIGIIENQYTDNVVKEKLNSIKGVNVSYANKETINTDMILAKYLGIIEFNKDNRFTLYSLDKNTKLEMKNAISKIIDSGKTKEIESIVSTLESSGLSLAERSIGFIFITFIISCTISSSVILKDKKDNILIRYVVTPNKLYSYIMGNYIYNSINTIIQVVIVALLLYLFKIDTGLYINQFIIIGILISITASSISTLITVLSNSELQSSLVASSISLLMALLGGVFLPLEKMPET